MFRNPSGRGLCFLAILDLPGDSMAAVLLTVKNGRFVKARSTFEATEREFGGRVAASFALAGTVGDSAPASFFVESSVDLDHSLRALTPGCTGSLEQRWSQLRSVLEQMRLVGRAA